MANLVIKKCIACCIDLPLEASVCSKCRSHQKAWKNYLQYFSTMAALFTLIFTALVYVASQATHLLKFITWEDRVEVLFLRVTGAMSILNVGDGDVFAYSFQWKSDLAGAPHFELFQLNRKLSADGSVEKIDLKREDGKNLGSARYLLIEQVPESTRKGVLTRALSKNDECYDLRIFSKEDTGVAGVLEFTKGKAWTIPLEGSISLRSFKWQTTFSQHVPLLGAVVQKDDTQCTK